MKKILTMAIMMTIAISAAAMPYNTARNEALFLSDKMAYELGLTATQYEAVYEINLDYLLNLDNRADVFGFWWEIRNRDLRYVLSDWQYSLFMAREWFYRPVIWTNTGVTFSIYARYDHGRMFRSHPTAFVNFRGGHSHRNSSFYTGHYFDRPTPPSGHGNPNNHNNNGNHNNSGNWNHGGNHNNGNPNGNGNHNNGNHNNNGNWNHNGNHNNGNPTGNGNHTPSTGGGHRPSGNGNPNPSMGGGFGNGHGSGSAHAPSRTGGSRTSGSAPRR